MVHILEMPKLSPTMTEGTIAKWHKKPGDAIEPGDVVLEIATDKATVEHNALDPGFLRQILLEEGKTAEVGAALALLTDTKDEPYEMTKGIPLEKQIDAVSAPIASKTPTAEAVLSSPISAKSVFASPLAKKLAKAKGINLTSVQGSGPRGRIMSRDLDQIKTPSVPISTEITKIPLTPMRKVIGERLAYAKANIPHFYINISCDCTELSRMQEVLKEENVTFTVTDFLIRATALSLMEHPTIRTNFDAKESLILQYPHADISIAVAIEGGLITPILFAAEAMPVAKVSQELKSLAQKARAGKLTPQEYVGGCFTISNLGMFGIPEFQAIINPPQCAILAVGAIAEEIKSINGQFISRKMLKLSLSVDHRVIDGAAAAKFLGTLKKYLEKPALLLV